MDTHTFLARLITVLKKDLDGHKDMTDIQMMMLVQARVTHMCDIGLSTLTDEDFYEEMGTAVPGSIKR